MMHKERESVSKKQRRDQDDKCYLVEYSRSNNSDTEVLEYYYVGGRIIKHATNRTITSQASLQTKPRREKAEWKQVIRSQRNTKALSDNSVIKK